MIARAEQKVEDSQERTAGTGQLEIVQYSQNGAARMGQAGQSRQNKTARTGLPGQSCQDRTASTELPAQYC
jgi:hypothetical protein